MKRSLASRRAARSLAIGGEVVILACHQPGLNSVGAAPVERDDPAHPAILVGGWIDMSHTVVGDTSVWILRKGGDDRNLHIVARSPGEPPKRSEHHYARWFVRKGSLLCFNQRPGRNGDSCSAFTIDTIVADGQTRRRLMVRAYVSSHHTADRVLLEREAR